MTVRTGYVGTEVAGDVLTAANFNKLPGGLIGYASANSNQTTITSPVDLTGLTITLTPNSSRLLRIDWKFDVQSTVNGDNGVVSLLRDGSQIDAQFVTVSSVDKIGLACGFSLDVGPSNASHVYKLQFGRTGASAGTWNTRASSTELVWIAISDVGPSF